MVAPAIPAGASPEFRFMARELRILSVGQCSADHGSISRHLASTLDARVVGAGTAAEALAALRTGSFDLVLVNRIGDADGAPGLELIRSLKAAPELAAIPVMLVSNYADAQAQAVGLGALPGFGKAELAAPTTGERLKAVLGSRG